MSYKSLLTVLTDTDFAETTLKQAAAFARAQNAHLDVLCLGLDRSQTGYYYAGATALVVEQSLNVAREEVGKIEALAEAFLKKTETRWGIETGISPVSDLTRHVAARARFADLTMLSKPYGPDHGFEMESTVEAALFEAQAPVLVLPDQAEPVVAPKTITIAWNESPEALRAVRAALPLLRAAELVRVVVIDPPSHGPNRSDPGGLLSQFLARHGVRVEVDVMAKSLPRISDVLLRHANDNDVDLIVMGAYGHSRFRESILGGATRHMLEQSEVPIFMAH
ncbi:MAG: universal stress protein [Cognatishimia sp.]|uniref:universal stress protein n=1 Tax=Cognatishimia sp. 1_MG-2023 TaxID=3062642 RepID=UPI0026E284F7|nr:universal stress protein [Cognatishimia sp. 1_MG-2023]MDO6727646.1 universal stress protein [Cognatishimia sp. 1_MG-2023]